jgi:alanine-glyoxylate transaminase/serine-glyoxylate transaminase/serine-pyruvate transaminase
MAGRHFLQIPGPTNVPDRILRAMDRPTIDHRGPGFAALGRRVLERIRPVFGTQGEVIIYPASGTGAWEAALVNTLSPGDAVLMYETGQFARLWSELAERCGFAPEVIPETSTGCVSDIPAVRAALDAAGHPALLMVDTISSLASIDYRHDAWGVDVTIAGSQKGLMLPPGLSFNAVSEKALASAASASTPCSYWSWEPMRKANASGMFPYTPATNLLYGLDEALTMLEEEGLAQVFARHDRHAEATRCAVRAWDLEILCRVPEHYSSSLTAVCMPEGHDADAYRKVVLENYDMSLGSGLGEVAGKIFRIGHLGDFNDLTLLGTLCGVEMGLHKAGVPYRPGGVQAAMDCLDGKVD